MAKDSPDNPEGASGYRNPYRRDLLEIAKLIGDVRGSGIELGPGETHPHQRPLLNT